MYPPRRIATLLQAPAPRWRAYICQVLRVVDEQAHPKFDWEGVAPALATVARNDPEPLIRRLAERALDRVPILSSSEAQRLLEFGLESGEPSFRETALFLCGRLRPDLHLALRAALQKLSTGPADSDRWVGLSVWRRLFPDEPDCAMDWLLALVGAP